MLPTNPDDPYLVTLGFDDETFEKLSRLRSRYFPTERNIVPAHLTLFHKLPPKDFVKRIVEGAGPRFPPLALNFKKLNRLAQGVAIEVACPELIELRGAMARRLWGWLTPQDRQPYKPHVTIQNRAKPAEAKIALAELRATWAPWTGTGTSLKLWIYRGGPWEPVGDYPLSGK